ncbi:MAG: oxygen-independent coproporphyrinogen III oxidase [Bacteroidales bacterium]|nr:oxygen-independent coproporphyrinogen III oxidase [Bacteroidales bacterium]
MPEYLLRKYDVPVPRYTSYPPANYFTEGFTEAEGLKLVEESNQGNPSRIAVYIHIPFCRKICYYCGCNACSIGKNQWVLPYVEALKQEISLVAAHLDKHREVSMIHFGGGTPNAIDVEFLGELISHISERFGFIEDPEIAIECNPAYLDPRYLESLKKAGFNRFSLGIQDFNPEIMGPLNRESSAMPVQEIISLLKAGSPGNGVNLDFIYGLPGQTPESFAKTIEQAIDLRPDRLVTFSYAHVPWLKKHQLILEKMGLPSAESKMEMFLAAYNLLKEAGYIPLGLDHYVLPHDELSQAIRNRTLHRNFQGYCTRRTTGQVYAFGVSAISQLENGYIQNTRELGKYVDALGNGTLAVERGCHVTDKQQVIRQVITEIMCNKHISWSEQAAAFATTPENLKSCIHIDEAALRDFEDDGLVVSSQDEINVTETGSLFIRNIAASFDPDFKQSTNLYSRSV